ncbi:STAS domain-containing protein [Magnetospirillum sp. SS-4]|uniref:STAS domain-containing protein n=1 Tax=Magnetospirillum sp. SS-4 TaxID=2681465 RepID=UPI0013803D79|nr:STAS domain-containing protein [Magnetospirillum sp. SS-4]CAA7627557.1 hypothetical protein MTBSS4_90091 [Magnetospirillum sp. SS-4]
MTCLVAHTATETIIKLSRSPDQDAFEAARIGLEGALDRDIARIIVDLTGLRQADPALEDLLEELRRQAGQAGIAFELRNLSEDLERRLRMVCPP